MCARLSALLIAPFAIAAAQEPAASLRGTVTDSIRHGPLIGATVVVSQTGVGPAGEAHDYTATTDAHGKYSIGALRPGSYVVTVEHPWLDSTGLGVPARNIAINGSSTTVNLAVPSSATIRSVYCPIAAHDSTIGLVAGYVRDANTDHPVGGARVVFTWNDFDVDRRTARATPRRLSASVITGHDGTFRVCGLPVLRPMLMQAQFGDHEATGAIDAMIPASSVLVETLRLDASVVRTAMLAGTVQRDGALGPIAGAHVRLYGAATEVLSAADGSFHLSDVPLGTQSIEVTALGFYPRRYMVDVHSKSTESATIGLIEVAKTLDSIRIIAKRQATPLWDREFDDRRAHGQGQYITEEMIVKADPFKITDLLRQANGFRVSETGVVTSTRGAVTIASDPTNATGGGGPCSPPIYLNGMPFQLPLDNISPAAIHGIEVYASSAAAPVQYHGGACGIILVWTK
jgi:hypothetical protein